MSKNKNDKSLTEEITDSAKQAGMVLMAAAATVGLLELPAHPNKRVVVPTQPNFAFASDNPNEEMQANQLRREREETGPHYISYSVAQRTPGRTGKI